MPSIGFADTCFSSFPWCDGACCPFCKANKSTYWVLFELFHGTALVALLFHAHRSWQRASLGCGATSSASLLQSTASWQTLIAVFPTEFWANACQGNKIFKLYGVSGGDWAAWLQSHMYIVQQSGAKEWQSDAKLFQLWARGLTGYPLVDANMRELRGPAEMHPTRSRCCGASLATISPFSRHLLGATGFMSNRGRQNVASFLALDMKIDWHPS